MPNLEDLPAGLATTIISPSIVTTTPAAQKNPRGVFQAGKYPMRVVVRNISPNGVGVLLSYSSSAVQEGTATPANAFLLPAGTSETFVLLPREALYTSSPNAGAGLLSVIASVAFPFEVKP